MGGMQDNRFQDTGRRFESTSWTLVERARDTPADLEKLLAHYWPPVYAYLRRHGHRRDDAADLTQAFVCDVVIGRGLLHKADRARGKFRSFLIAALTNFVRDERRKERGRPNGASRTESGEVKQQSPRPKMIACDEAALEASEPREADDPAAAFNRQWATTVVNIAVQRLEASCRASGMDVQWTVFEERELRPLQHGCEPTSFGDLMRRAGVQSEQKLYTMLQTMRRKFETELRRAIAETVADPDEVEAELRELRRFLSA